MLSGHFRAAAVTRARAPVMIAGRGECSALPTGLRISGFAASSAWTWLLALLVVVAAVAIALLAHARLPSAPAVENVAPGLLVLGLAPLFRLDARPTRRPRTVEVPWDKVREVTFVRVRGVSMLRIDIEDAGTVDFCPDGDPIAAHMAMRDCIVGYRLHLPR